MSVAVGAQPPKVSLLYLHLNVGHAEERERIVGQDQSKVEVSEAKERKEEAQEGCNRIEEDNRTCCEWRR